MVKPGEMQAVGARNAVFDHQQLGLLLGITIGIIGGEPSKKQIGDYSYCHYHYIISIFLIIIVVYTYCIHNQPFKQPINHRH